MLEREPQLGVDNEIAGLLCGDCMRNKTQIARYCQLMVGKHGNLSTYPCNLPEAGCMMITCRRHILYDIASFKKKIIIYTQPSRREPEKICIYQNICVSGWFTISVNTVGEVD